MVAKMEKEEKERKKTHTYTALLRSETYHVIKYTGAFAVTRDFEKCTDLNVRARFEIADAWVKSTTDRNSPMHADSCRRTHIVLHDFRAIFTSARAYNLRRLAVPPGLDAR